MKHKQQPDLPAGFVNARWSDVSPALFVADSLVHGKGLFAAADLPADQVLGRLLGHPVAEDGEHVLWLSDAIGLELVDDLRFINHRAPPNCAITDQDVVTLTPITRGEELFHDYGW